MNGLRIAAPRNPFKWRWLSVKTLFHLAVCLLVLPALCAADETIRGHYCYTYGDNESLREARESTRTLAIRDAVESFGVYVVSTMTVKDFVLTDDLVNTISSGYLKNIEVLAHTEEGRTICDTIQGRISPQDVQALIDGEVRKRTPAGAPAKNDANGCLEILQAQKWYTQVKVVVRVLKATGALVTPADLESKPCYRVQVDFMDADGIPVGNAGQYLHNSPNSMLPGEVATLYFDAPYGAANFKAWLAP